MVSVLQLCQVANTCCALQESVSPMILPYHQANVVRVLQRTRTMRAALELERNQPLACMQARSACSVSQPARGRFAHVVPAGRQPSCAQQPCVASDRTADLQGLVQHDAAAAYPVYQSLYEAARCNVAMPEPN